MDTFIDDICRTVDDEVRTFLELQQQDPECMTGALSPELAVVKPNDIIIPRLPANESIGDVGRSRHYLSEKWMRSHRMLLTINSEGPLMTIMDGTCFVKYIGSCTGGVRIKSTGGIIDRSNNFYYLGIGDIDTNILTDRFTHLADSFMMLMACRRFKWLHHKLDLLPIKFCQAGSMYNYALIYSIRLKLPSSCSSLIGSFIGFGTAFYHSKTNRFFRVGDHHSARKIRTMSYKNVHAYLVISRKHFVNHLQSSFIDDHCSTEWVWTLFRSMLHAAEDFLDIPDFSLVALADGSDCKCSFMVITTRMADGVSRIIASMHGDPGCVILEGCLILILLWPDSPSIDSRYTLRISLDRMPSVRNGSIQSSLDQ